MPVFNRSAAILSFIRQSIKIIAERQHGDFLFQSSMKKQIQTLWSTLFLTFVKPPTNGKIGLNRILRMAYKVILDWVDARKAQWQADIMNVVYYRILFLNPTCETQDIA
jgi:hypothetical protein